jgi:hypothetical protein
MLVKTLAEGFMILHLTVRIFTTFCPVTRVDTFPIATPMTSAGQLGSAVSVGCAFIRIFAPFCVGIAHQPSGTGALERAGYIGTIGRGVTDGVLAFIYVLTASRSVDEANSADTRPSLTDLAGATILLLVTAWLAGAVNANFSLETIFV